MNLRLPPMPLTTLGHYRLDSQLGQGGMGEVFLAFDTRLNRQVAIKVMRAREGHLANADRFLREARAVSSLNHPNIVIIHDFGQTPDGDHFIVQEFIDGETLRKFLVTPMALDKIVAMGMQIARALAAAHGAGIVHRDIKPDNIMVRADGYLKVLDFGLARVVETDVEVETTHTNYDTAPGTLLGTMAYLSPEQASGRPAGPAADIFAMGIVLYEMATGKRPFLAPTGMGVVAAILSEHPVPIARMNPLMPPALDDLVMRMLKKQAERRPSAQEVEQHLEFLLAVGGGPSTAAGTARAANVGRETQRTQLRRAYQRVKNGRGIVVAVTGEPGLGKTTLAEDIIAELMSGAERPIVARGRCSESLAGSEAYMPIIEAIDSLLRHVSGASLESVLKTVAPTWYGQVATHYTETLTGGQSREPAPAASPERMKRELAALIQEASRRQPLVLFIEDLHWADVSTVDMLNYLAGRFEGLRVLVLTTYRPSDMTLSKHPFLGIRRELQQRGNLEEVSLTFLETSDVDRYLSLQFPDHKLPADFASVIHAKTEGSPLFMADLLRYLRDSGGIVQEDGTWVLARALSQAPRDLPESVRGMIERKIEQVDEEDRKLLVAASVQGAEFDSATVAEAIDMDAAEVEDRFEKLERVYVFVARGEEHEFPDRTVTLKYRFVHVLYQNVLFASLQPTRRAALSGRIAKSLETHHGDETAPIAGRLAVLFETARDFAKAARYFYVAAQRTVVLFGWQETWSLADRGLAAVRGLPEGPERLQTELRLQMLRAVAIRFSKGWSSSDLEKSLVRARQICQQLQDAPELFPVMYNVTFFRMIRGDLAEVREQLKTLAEQAESSQSEAKPAYKMAVQHLACVTCEFSFGDVIEANHRLEEARELHAPAEHKRYTAMFGTDPGMLARAMSARVLWALGHPDRAEARSLETIGIARKLRHPSSLVFSLMVAQSVYVMRRQSGPILELGEEISPLCREFGLPQEAEWTRGFQSSGLALAGRLDEAVAGLQQALAALAGMRSFLVRTLFQSLLADALLRAGRVEEGLATLDEREAVAEKTGERGFDAECFRLRGGFLLLAGDEAAAEKNLRAAIEHARGKQAKGYELRAAIDLARLLVSRGQRAEGREVLAPVFEWFTEGFDTYDLVAAKAVLTDIG